MKDTMLIYLMMWIKEFQWTATKDTKDKDCKWTYLDGIVAYNTRDFP